MHRKLKNWAGIRFYFRLHITSLRHFNATKISDTIYRFHYIATCFGQFIVAYIFSGPSPTNQCQCIQDVSAIMDNNYHQSCMFHCCVHGHHVLCSRQSNSTVQTRVKFKFLICFVLAACSKLDSRLRSYFASLIIC
jgi:hypothetical protein